MKTSKLFGLLFGGLAALAATVVHASASVEVDHDASSTVVVTDDDSNQLNDQKTCTWETRFNCTDDSYRDPNLKLMTVKLSTEDNNNDEHDEEKEAKEEIEFWAYVDPDISLAYNTTPGSIKPKYASFNGMYAKFINMSPKTVMVHWEQKAGGTRSFMSQLGPFATGSTASYPTHRFVVVDQATGQDVDTWIVSSQNCLYYYDPYKSLQTAKSALKPNEYELYKMHYHSLEFNEQYKAFTGRQYLPDWKRDAPHLPIWPADSFGQTHVIKTRETHIESTSSIPKEVTQSKVGKTGATETELAKLKPYRNDPDVDGILQLNMTCISVMPRAFEIQNFFSSAEAEHILELATGMNLQASSVGGNSNSRSANTNVRTSRNSWIYRDRSVIVDVLHRRAADLLQLDEALLRRRTADEQHLLPGGKIGPIVEPLQLVHYDYGQQYTPHFDFFPSSIQYKGQPARFATLLLYLNNPEKGGETSFPRWVNGETQEILEVKPEIGKAVLFYNQLPDGNFDDRSQHSAKPLIKGEKWMTNFWVWDPYNSKEILSS
mmetsp:Transcript_8876/g.22364  ORF Transcript_8876/g.22364 Transcript_8876/m.22364 type:complete len:546 (-) Transcript_8876:1998-3635(-)